MAAHVRDSVNAAIRGFYTDLNVPDHTGQTPRGRFSLARMLRELHSDGVRDGIERELCSAYSTLMGVHFDPQRPMLPLGLVDTRDLTTASASGGGYVVGSKPRAATDTLGGWSVTESAGMTVIDNLVGNVTIPETATDPTAAALPTEATALSESNPTLKQVAMTPRTLGTYMEFSRLLGLQTPNLDAWLGAICMRKVGALLDVNVLNGSGASGQLSGIYGNPNISTQSGSSLAFAGIRAMRKASINAGALESDLAWIGAADTQETLAGRERFSGGGRTLWDDDGIVGRPAHAAKAAPNASLIVGPWSSAVLGLWGGLTLEYNPFAGFQQGIRGVRLLVSADLAVTNAPAFVVSTSIT